MPTEEIAPPAAILVPRKIQRFGCIPDQPNKHRPLFSLTHPDTLTVARPPKIDLWDTSFMPPIWNQGDLGSCTAHGLGRCLSFLLAKNGTKGFMPSRLELYFQERAIEGTIKSDAGAQIADGVTVLNTVGVGHETLWTYDDTTEGAHPKFTQKPPATVTKDAKKYKTARGSSIANLSELLANLGSGYPAAIGISVHQSFESADVARTGLVPMPGDNRDALIGGHCIAATGYDDAKQLVTCDNSWDTSWGVKGRFYLPYSYFTADLTSDMWAIRTLAA